MFTFNENYRPIRDLHPNLLQRPVRSRTQRSEKYPSGANSPMDWLEI
jgi:hypothetical protein